MDAHIRPRWIDEPGIRGEFTPSDYGVFLSVPELAHVSSFWDALVVHSLAVDKISAESAESCDASKKPHAPEDAAWIEAQHATAQQAHSCLTRASMLSLLAGFVEFSLLETHKLVLGAYPTKTRPDIVRDVIRPLETELGALEIPTLYQTTVLDTRDTIRNALQHGRWMELEAGSDKVDMHDAFIGVVAYCGGIEELLRKAGKIG